MKLFIDTSVLVKRYVREPGSEKLPDLLDAASEVVVSITALPEAISAFRRVYREKKLSLAQYTECKKELMADFQDFSVCDLTPEVLGRAIDCIENASLRTLDALQVACALSAEVDCFASSDQQQLKAANKAGLKVVHV